jgi:mono/diheme cytochrome c family protein
MKASFMLGACAIVALVATTVAPLSSSGPPATKKIARGKYLVENAGTCQDCHSPRNERGEFIREQWLDGAELMFRPTVPIPGFTSKAPAIAGLRNWTEQQAVKFLMTGVQPSGSMANPPMPPFRFNQEDAEAIVTYLKSLKPPPTPSGAKSGNQ